MRFLAEYMMRGRMQAIMVASTLAILSLLVPPLSVLSSAGVALVTLRHGIKEGFWVLLTAAVSTAILSLVISVNPQFVFAYVSLLWLPIWVMAIVLRVTGNMTKAIEMAVVLGLLMVVLFYFSVSNPADLWNSILNQLMEPMLASAPDDVPIDEIKLSIERFSHYMTGMAAAGSVFGLTLGILLARWWQSQLFNPGGFGQEFTSLKSSPKFAIATLIIIAIGFISDGSVAEFALNISIPLTVLFTFIGFAVIHVLMAARKNAQMMTPLFYGTMVLLFFVTPLVIMPVAFAGLTDNWLNLRDKISNQTNR